MLGDFKFAADTAAYNQLRRTSAYRWQAQDRQGRNPALQFAGAGADEIELTGIIYPPEFGSAGQVQAMRDMAALGTPLSMIAVAEVNKGILMGKWAIKSIEDGSSYFLPGGTARKIEFTIRLAFYGEDK